MFKKLNLKQSMLLGSIIPVLLFVISALVVYGKINKTEYLSALSGEAYTNIALVSQIELNLAEMKSSSRTYILSKNDASLKNYNEVCQSIHSASEELKKRLKDTPQMPALLDILGNIDKVKEQMDQGFKLVDISKADQAITDFSSGDSLKLGRELKGKIKELKKKENDIKNVQQKLENDARKVSINVLIWGTLLALVAAIWLGFLIAIRTSKRIVEVVNNTSTISTQIAATINEHERTANNQAAMITETTTTLAELGASSRQTADQSATVATMAQKANVMTEEGSDAVHQAIGAMENLKMKFTQISEQILNLSDKTEQIGNIAELVKDLSEQINMLALNAAVEAARAGEHGKGFAVVAAEVRKLSVESKKSAGEAKVIVNGIQKATDAVIMRTEEGAKNIDDVSMVARRLSHLFNELSDTSGIFFNSAQQVLLNAKEQASAITQVLDATSSINAGAKETVSGLSQTKIGIQNLNEATLSLQKML